jgi:hypothetical protein
MSSTYFDHALVHPIELTGYVRSLVFDEYSGPSSLERFLPTVRDQVTEYEFFRTDETRPRMGRFRAYDAESALQDRPGYERVTGGILPMSEKMRLSEADKMDLQRAQRMGGTRNTMLREIVFRDAERLANALAQRIEYARAKLLTTGTVTFTSDEDVKTTIDFNVGGRAVQTATASPLWSDTASGTPLDDMRTWMSTYRDNNNEAEPVIGITSKRVLDALQLSEQVVNQRYAGSGVNPGILLPNEVSSVWSAWGFPPLVEYRCHVNLAGTVTRTIADNVIVFLPAPSTENFGQTIVGVSDDAQDLAESYGNEFPAGEAPGLVGVNWKTPDPNTRWTKVGGLVLPILKDPEKILVATVLS